MTETTYYLCQKPIIGVLMWLSCLCVSNQALKDGNELDLSKEGLVLQKTISIPMNERYDFSVQFEFADAEAYSNDLIGGSVALSSAAACTDTDIYNRLSQGEKDRHGANIDIRIDIETKSGQLYATTKYQSRCVSGWGDKSKSRGSTAHVALAKGTYVLKVVNNSAIPLQKETKIHGLLTGAGAGFP